MTRRPRTSRERLASISPGLVRSRLAWFVCAWVVLAASSPAAAVEIVPVFVNLTVDEEAVFQASFGRWELAILDLFPFAVTIEKRALSGDTLARTVDFTQSADGRPASARIEIDDRAGEAGWFVDPTPFESSEYLEKQGRLLADPAGPAWLLFDLLTVGNHEMGHALGFTVNHEAFAAHVVSQPDGQRRYRSAALDVPLASGGTHLPYYAFPSALMSDLTSVGERRFPSTIDLLLLEDAFAYDVVLPPDRPPPVPEPPVALLLAGILPALACRLRFRQERRQPGGPRGNLASTDAGVPPGRETRRPSSREPRLVGV